MVADGSSFNYFWNTIKTLAPQNLNQFVSVLIAESTSNILSNNTTTMADNQFVVCFNALEKRFFEVNAVHLVEEPFRRNFYRFSLRLNFYDGDVDLNLIEDMRRLCFKKITNLMTSQNMWQNHHSFYVISYEIRLLPKKSNDIQHNDRERNDESSDESSLNSSIEHSFSTDDSAYSSPSSGSLISDDSYSESTDEAFENSDSIMNELLTTSDDELYPENWNKSVLQTQLHSILNIFY